MRRQNNTDRNIMTDQNFAQFNREGQPAFGEENIENENSTESQPEENKTEENPSPEGENNKNTQEEEDNTPFHKHPRWLEREQEWKDRFNEMEQRHQDEIKAVREDFGNARKSNAETKSEMPIWFGGTQEQWEAYVTDREAEIKAAEERAIQRITEAKTKEDKAVEEATAHMQSEMAAIETDTTLNPKGLKVDPNKLLKIVMDNDLIDSKGRWNYRAGFRILEAQAGNASPAKKVEEKKKIAGATTSEGKAEPKPQQYKTSEDFKKNRPW